VYFKSCAGVDVTFSEGPGMYHQMDVMGDAPAIRRNKLITSRVPEVQFAGVDVSAVIGEDCYVATEFAEIVTIALQMELQQLS
jgi:serine/threonine-protein kinase HipA